jgi:death-on-curing protein
LANEPVWLTADHLIEFNELDVSATGEPHLVRDKAGLESAIARPINHWHYGEGDVVALAVALLLGVARNHPFLLGNKRTAFAAADYFSTSTATSFGPRTAKTWRTSWSMPSTATSANII